MKTIFNNLEVEPRKGEPLIRAYERKVKELAEGRIATLEPQVSQPRARVMGLNYTPTE